jgi:hypothetical protein
MLAVFDSKKAERKGARKQTFVVYEFALTAIWKVRENGSEGIALVDDHFAHFGTRMDSQVQLWVVRHRMRGYWQ